MCLLVLFLAPSYTLQLVLCSGSADTSSLSFYNPGRHAGFAACLGWGSSASSLFQCACSCLSPLSWIDPDCFVAWRQTICLRAQGRQRAALRAASPSSTCGGGWSENSLLVSAEIPLPASGLPARMSSAGEEKGTTCRMPQVQSWGC